MLHYAPLGKDPDAQIADPQGEPYICKGGQHVLLVRGAVSVKIEYYLYHTEGVFGHTIVPVGRQASASVCFRARHYRAPQVEGADDTSCADAELQHSFSQGAPVGPRGVLDC